MGAGFYGWGYTFNAERAKRLVLRSQRGRRRPRTRWPEVRPFRESISRSPECFEYHQVDATHATDFFQVEGIVLGADINFRTLLGLSTCSHGK